MRFIAIILTFLVAATFSQTTNADDESERSAELQVLDRSVGTWDVDMTTKSTEGKSTTHKYTERGEWSLGGQFIHSQKADKDNSGPPEYHVLMTYDPATKAYSGIEMFGTARFFLNATWDEATSSMTYSGKSTADNGITFVCKSRFIDKDHIQASSEIKNAEGDVLTEITYKHTRRKE